MKCSIEGCEREIKHSDLCGMHYKRKWRHGNPLHTETPTRGFERTKCKIEDCNNTIDYGNGHCKLHYQRDYRYGRTNNIKNDKGVGGFDSNGYYMLTINGRRVAEHVYKAEQALGKPLPKGAVVHHMNGIKHDNDTPFNLVICLNQSYHLLLHRRAKELGYENN